MRARTLRLLSACVVVIAAAAAAYTAVSMAGSGGLANVPTANTRSQGYAPASVLSPELQQVVVAQGSTKLENPMDNVSYYGYDDDVKNSAGQPVMVASAATSNKEAHKTEPDKNTYLVFDAGLTGADSGYNYGTHAFFQGTGNRHWRSRRHHPHQPRRRRRPSGDLARDQGRHGRGDQDHRWLDLGSVGEAAAVHDREPDHAHVLGHSGVSVAGARRLRRARARRL
jgi:hypothetical protein